MSPSAASPDDSKIRSIHVLRRKHGSQNDHGDGGAEVEGLECGSNINGLFEKEYDHDDHRDLDHGGLEIVETLDVELGFNCEVE